MQRKPTKTTRGPNLKEKQFAAWVKWRNCCCCGAPAPSIVHHAEGATFKHLKILCGHWFLLPLCPSCDEVITKGSRRAFRERFGTQAELWLKLLKTSPVSPPHEVVEAIRDWTR